MYWDIFQPFRGISNPAEPGDYLGSVFVPLELDETGINPHTKKLDLHLRKTGRVAYSEKYNLIKYRKNYNWR